MRPINNTHFGTAKNFYFTSKFIYLKLGLMALSMLALFLSQEAESPEQIIL